MTFDTVRGLAPILGGLALALQAVACTPELELADEPDAGPDAGLQPLTGVDAGRHLPPDASFADPSVLAEALAGPGGLSFDDAAAYVMSRPGDTGGRILKIDRASGTVVTLASSTEPSHLVADARYVYWSDRGDGKIRRIDKLGEGLVTIGFASAEVTNLAVGADGSLVWITSAGEVRRADGQDQGGIVLRRFEDPATGLVVQGTDAVVSLASGEMWRLPLAGGEPTLLFTNESFERGFVSDGKRFYWISRVARSIRTGHLSGGESHAIVADVPDAVDHLAVSYRYVIWSDPEAGAIRRAFKTGTGPVETMATGLGRPAEIAALDFFTAWVNRGDGTIMEMPL